MVAAKPKPRALTLGEAQEMEERLNLIGQKIWGLSMTADDEESFSGLSEAEREAKKAKLEEERLLLTREYELLLFATLDPDFSGMSEADRAVEAARIKLERQNEARRLRFARDPRFRELEGEARIIDFDPKQGGLYF